MQDISDWLQKNFMKGRKNEGSNISRRLRHQNLRGEPSEAKANAGDRRQTDFMAYYEGIFLFWVL